MPEWKPEIRARLAGLPLAAGRAEEIAEELSQHLDDRHAELVARGASEAEARAAALDELASPEALRQGLDDVLRAPAAAPALGAPAPGRLLGGLGADLRYAARSLTKSRGFTAVAVATLALGIGASAVIFSVVNAVLLRPLPYAAPDRLVAFWGSAPEMGLPVVNYPDAFYAYYRARSHTLGSISAYEYQSATLTGAGEAERLNSAAVTVDFFKLLGETPLHGRTFLPEEEKRGAPVVAVIGHGLWQRRFGGDPAVIGKPLVLDGKPVTVVGVMPAGFDFPPRSPGSTDLWLPLQIDPQSLDCWCWMTLGRLQAGQTPESAAREIARLGDDFWRDRDGKARIDPASSEPVKSIVYAMPLQRRLVDDVRTPLFVLLGAVAVVLLIGCANVANLLLARATARGREIAVRSCLGASPWRIARALLVESLLLAAGGAAAGLALAYAAVRVVGRIVAERVVHVHAVSLEPRVVLATVLLTVSTAVIFGLVPALRAARLDLHEAVKEGARGSRGTATRRLNHAFVVSQFALSIMLLVGAGLLLRSFRNLLDLDMGFRPENVVVGRVALPPALRDEPQRMAAFFDQLVERVGSLPGARAAGLASIAPFSGGDNGQIFMIRGREPAPGQPDLVTRVRVVTPGYFAAVGTPLLRGRLFEEGDRANAPLVALVDETLARRFWPDGDAVGHEVRLGNAQTTNAWLRIVGVVPTVRHQNPAEDANRYVYVPFAQHVRSDMDVVVRSAADPGPLVAAIRRELASLDRSLPLYEVHTLEAAVADSLGTRRVTNALLMGFAVAALLLASLGVYGVMAQNVSHRVNEFGIRLALGAAPRDVLRLVLGQGLRLVAAGVAIGLAGAVWLGRLLGSLLFHVQALDPATFGGVVLVLALVAVGACYLPARRATATDPLRALRYE